MDIQDIPEWAIEEACKRANAVWASGGYAFIIYTADGIKRIIEDRRTQPVLMVAAECIAKYEKPPVPPLEMKAREIYIKTLGFDMNCRGKEILRDGPEKNQQAFKNSEYVWKGIRLALGLSV